MIKKTIPVIHDKILANKIYFIRGQKVMIDRDLAELYGVQTKQLKRQVDRNIERFPLDFMFQLTKEEYRSRCQIGTLNDDSPSKLQGTILKRGENLKYLPYAFTEQGVAMLSSVLNSKQAIAVNIQIIRVFTKMRELISSNKEILMKLEQLEKKVGNNSDDIEEIFSALKDLINPDLIPRKVVGYKWKKQE
jgi:phage regulator Rha-like protein